MFLGNSLTGTNFPADVQWAVFRNFLSADMNNDCSVTILDIATMALAFDSTPGSPTWNSKAGLNSDGIVDIIDLARAAAQYGATC